MTDELYDLLVIGGGINGAGIARDAAGRGLKVLLCEKGDLGGATSSASSKLIHGGLRYLEYYEFRLVREALGSALDKPYFIPESTPLHTQLRNFQQKKMRLAIVVDEYGDVIGLVAVADILEEIVGEFTSNLHDSGDDIFPQRDGSFVIDGGAGVRDVNKALGWHLPTDGPKTISGLVLEHLESFPDGNAGLKIGRYGLEILELEGNVVRVLRGRTLNAAH